MALPLPSRSTQIGIQKRFPVIEFEPLLDAIEAASLLRMHPKDAQEESVPRRDPRAYFGKYWRFRVSDLNDWLYASGAGRLLAREPCKCQWCAHCRRAFQGGRSANCLS